MANSPAVNDLSRPSRRSTRLSTAVPITVMGVDSHRGPYREDVSTLDVSCHGCRYESKHEVAANSWMMLELKLKEDEPVSAKGLVKWVKPTPDRNGYETAIELQTPANIWGIDSPPPDWALFGESHVPAGVRVKPFPVSSNESAPKTAIAERPGNGSAAHAVSRSVSPIAGDRRVDLLVGQFHEQMEKVLYDAADAAVQQRADEALSIVRDDLHEEAKKILNEVAAAQTGPWMDQALKQLSHASQEIAKTLYTAWAKRLDADSAKVIERIEERGKEFEILTQTLSANALDRLQRGLETSRGDGVDRIVARLDERSAPVIARVKEATAELAKQRDEFQTLIDCSLEASTSRIEEACANFEKRFESIAAERLEKARQELDSAIHASCSSAVDGFTASVEQRHSDAESRLKEVVQRTVDAALSDLKEKTSASTRAFTREISDSSRSQLEFVSKTIAQAASILEPPPTE
jgi:deoxyadenosine/deoxycytidine kinase